MASRGNGCNSSEITCHMLSTRRIEKAAPCRRKLFGRDDCLQELLEIAHSAQMWSASRGLDKELCHLTIAILPDRGFCERLTLLK